jgi:DNA endonuclease
MSGPRSGVPLRPTMERELLYHLVVNLRNEGRSYNQIVEDVYAKMGVRLSKSNVSGWVNGRHNPSGSVRVLDASPSPELAYVIGVKMGDASMSVGGNYQYMIKLRVTDKDFAEEFSRCLSLILGRTSPAVKWHEKTHAWHTQVSSLLLRRLLLQPLIELKSIVNCNDECRGAFLRGFFDSEGNVSGRSVTASNGDLDKLHLVKEILFELGIHTYGPDLMMRAGGMVMIKGRLCHGNKNMYRIRIAAASLEQFKKSVSFSIGRKANSLNGAVGEPSVASRRP